MGKECKRCGEEKPLSEFNRSRTEKDGLHYYCRACHKALQLESRQRRGTGLGRVKRDDYVKTCYRCREDKPATSFHFHQGHADGRTRICRACYRELGVRDRGAESGSGQSDGRDGGGDRQEERPEKAVLAG